MDGPGQIADPANDPAAIATRFLRHVPAGRPVLVAVSGGSDSVALLEAFASVSRVNGGPALHVATVDHGLRPEAAHEASHVGQLAAGLGLRHHLAIWQGDKPAHGIPAAARLARYRLLSDLAQEIGASVVLLGHTADDQDETRLMRSARNPDRSALGQSGMAPATLFDQQTWFCRPFLALRRDLLRRWLTAQAIGWIEDPTNENRAYERARIRASGPGRSLCEAPDRFALALATADWLAAVLSVPLAHLYRIGRAGLDPDQPAHLHGVATLMALAGGQTHRPGSDVMIRLADHLAGKAGLMSAGRVLVELRRDAVWIYRENRSLPVWPPADGTADWDRRFRLSPGVAAVRPQPVTDAIPSGVFLRARPGLAPILAADGPEVAPVLSLWQHFMPLFDWPVAQIVASLSSLQPFPPVVGPFSYKPDLARG